MRLLGAGDNVVDRYRRLGRYFPGGNAVNVAVFAARLGAEAAYLGIVGDDEEGRHVLESLRQEGVDTTHVRIAPGPNAYANVDLVGDERVFVGSDRGVAMFVPDPEQLEVMAGYDVVHCGYASALLPAVPELAARTQVSFDFGNRWDDEQVDRYAPSLCLASFSAGHLGVRQTVDLVARVVAGGARYALATRGAAGAFLAGPQGITFQPAEPVQPVDTLGAGDAFIATVIIEMFSGNPPETALAVAAQRAAEVCLDYGAFGHGVAYSPDAAYVSAASTKEPTP